MIRAAIGAAIGASRDRSRDRRRECDVINAVIGAGFDGSLGLMGAVIQRKDLRDWVRTVLQQLLFSLISF